MNANKIITFLIILGTLALHCNCQSQETASPLLQNNNPTPIQNDTQIWSSQGLWELLAKTEKLQERASPYKEKEEELVVILCKLKELEGEAIGKHQQCLQEKTPQECNYILRILGMAKEMIETLVVFIVLEGNL